MTDECNEPTLSKDFFNDYVEEGFSEFLDEAFEMPIGELIERIDNCKGKVSHPILLSVLCERVKVDLYSDDRCEKVKKKRLNGMANKVKNRGNKYEKY